MHLIQIGNFTIINSKQFIIMFKMQCKYSQFNVLALKICILNDDSPYNVLKLKGQFSVAEMHSWLSNCIPEMPERAPAAGEANLTFVSSFLDTLLYCSYR